MDLSTINIKGEVPLKEILQGSAYYAGSNDDGFPMKVCNKMWGDLGINSFVYCDFFFTREEIKSGVLGVIAGYNLVNERWLGQEEFIPREWSLNLYSTPKEKYLDRFWTDGPEPEHFAVWRIYKRTIHKDDSHGPEWLSFLYVCGEGFATYQQLYCHNKVAPKLIFFVNYWSMHRPQDDWESPQSAFFKMIKANHECAPEWVSHGNHNAIKYALRVWNMEELGARMVGYKNEEELKALIGEEAAMEQIKHPILGESVRRVVSEDKVYLLIECSGTIVYEIIDKRLSCEELLAQIVKTGAVSLKNKWLQENYNYLPIL